MVEEIGETELDAAAQADAVGKKVLIALNQYYDLEGQTHHSSPSIGVALFFGQQQSVDELLQRADLAMYQSKAAGRNTLRFFDPVMQAAASARAVLEADLRRAMEEVEFLLHYQPVVDEVGKTTGVEALLRWSHSTRGMVAPAEFIPAHHSGQCQCTSVSPSGVHTATAGFVAHHRCQPLPLEAGVDREHVAQRI